jgi:predicted MFS family arabinose efflux permease
VRVTLGTPTSEAPAAPPGIQAERSPRGFAALLRDRRFAALFGAHFVSNLGDWLAFLALFGLAALEWRASATRVGLLAIAYVLPLVGVAPWAGVLVDRWDLRRVLVVSDLARAGLVLAMAFAPGYPALCALLFLHQTAGCFFNPAQVAALPRLVARPHLLAANALTSSAAHAAKLLGPAVAGVLVAALGPRGCFLADSASFLLSGLALSTLPAMAGERSSNGSPAPWRGLANAWAVVRADFHEGLEFLRRAPRVQRVVGAVAWTMAPVGGFIAILAVYARDVLDAGPRTLGFLLSTLGVGAVGGALAVARLARHRSRLRSIGIGMLLGAIAFGILAAGHDVRVVAAGVFLLGAATAVSIVPAQALLQEETPGALLGRVTSVAVAGIGIVQGLGMGLAGPLVGVLGMQRFLMVAALWLAAGVIGACVKER